MLRLTIDVLWNFAKAIAYGLRALAWLIDPTAPPPWAIPGKPKRRRRPRPR
jgi:hypothetical protein